MYFIKPKVYKFSQLVKSMRFLKIIKNANSFGKQNNKY